MSGYENIIHALADHLIEHFEDTGAVNYIECTFESKSDSSKSFVLTMQKVNGLTPCEKLNNAEKLNSEMREMLEKILNCRNFSGGEIGHSDAVYELHSEIERLLTKARGEK